MNLSFEYLSIYREHKVKSDICEFMILGWLKISLSSSKLMKITYKPGLTFAAYDHPDFLLKSFHNGLGFIKLPVFGTVSVSVLISQLKKSFKSWQRTDRWEA